MRGDHENSDSTFSKLGLHEWRHTFASLMIAAGVNAEALSTYMGHSSITITLDRYGHLMPGAESEPAELLGGHLERGQEEAAGPNGAGIRHPLILAT